MPINSNGSSLKVETIVGDKTYENESYRDVAYPFNQQHKETRKAGTHPMDMSAFGHDNNEPIELTKSDEQVLKANETDLNNKAIK